MTNMPNSHSTQTHFLGWDAPLLVTSAEFLIEKYSQNQYFDGSKLLCVLPTQRSVNRIAKLLLQAAGKHGIDCILPSFITIGELPEQLYSSTRQTALEFEQTLAWASVLQKTAPEMLLLLIPTPPNASGSSGASGAEGGSIEPWLELASTLRRLHAELSTNQLRFGDVAQSCESESEIARWNLLDEMSNRYENALENVHLVDPDTARLQAMKEAAIQCDREIVLIGTSDINDLLVSMLRACQAKINHIDCSTQVTGQPIQRTGVR